MVNRERKLSQTEVQRELSGYEAQYRATLEKNAEIEAACAEVEKELQALVAELPKYALTPLMQLDISCSAWCAVDAKPLPSGTLPSSCCTRIQMTSSCIP